MSANTGDSVVYTELGTALHWRHVVALRTVYEDEPVKHVMYSVVAELATGREEVVVSGFSRAEEVKAALRDITKELATAGTAITPDGASFKSPD